MWTKQQKMYNVQIMEAQVQTASKLTYFLFLKSPSFYDQINAYYFRTIDFDNERLIVRFDHFCLTPKCFITCFSSIMKRLYKSKGFG